MMFLILKKTNEKREEKKMFLIFSICAGTWVLLTRRRHYGMPRQHIERVETRLDLYDTRDKLRDQKFILRV